MTGLATTVAACAVGAYRQHTTAGNLAALSDNGQSQSETGYVSRMPYDPINGRAYLASSDHAGTGRRLIAYDVATDAWVTIVPSSSPGSVAHGYGGNRIDILMRRFWHQVSGDSPGGLAYLNLNTGAIVTGQEGGWTGTYQAAESGCEFPDRHEVLHFHRTEFWRKRENAAWQQVSGSFPTSVHSIAHYSARHKCVVWGGGDDGTSGNLWRYNLDGTVQQYSGLPFGISQPRYRFVENPVTGEFHVYHHNNTVDQFWKFNPSILTAGAWTNVGITGIPGVLFGLGTLYHDTVNYIHLVAEDIFTHGCLLFVTKWPGMGTAQMWVYRYR